MDSPKYLAFLSYSHRDAKWGSWLHKALESYRPPKQIVGKVTPRGTVPKRLVPIFRDREELASATDLGTVINEALRLSGLPDRHLLSERRALALGERGDPGVQAARVARTASSA